MMYHSFKRILIPVIYLHHIVYMGFKRSIFQMWNEISMTSDKTKQPLCISKWQTVIVRGQDNDKMDATL